MKRMILLSLATLLLTSVGITRPMEGIYNMAWPLAQTAAGSTTGVIFCALLKEFYNNLNQPGKASKSSVQNNQQAPKPSVRLAPSYQPPKKPHNNFKENKKKWSPSSTSSSSSSAESPFRIFAQPKPQISYFQKLKNLPRTCAQAITLKAVGTTWFMLALAIVTYTTTSAGIHGISENLV